MNDMPGRHRYQPPPPPPMPTPPPSPAAAGRSFRLIMLGLLGGAILAGPTGFAMGAAVEKAGERGADTAVSASVPKKTRTPSPAPSPSPARRLTKNDLRLDVIEKRRKCFGSAGCNVTYEVEVTLLDMDARSDDSYEVSYRVRAGSQEIVRNTFELHGTKYSIPEDFSMAVPEGVKLRAVVASVKRLP